jgi:hypothetical protein
MASKSGPVRNFLQTDGDAPTSSRAEDLHRRGTAGPCQPGGRQRGVVHAVVDDSSRASRRDALRKRNRLPYVAGRACRPSRSTSRRSGRVGDDRPVGQGPGGGPPGPRPGAQARVAGPRAPVEPVPKPAPAVGGAVRHSSRSPARERLDVYVDWERPPPDSWQSGARGSGAPSGQGDRPFLSSASGSRRETLSGTGSARFVLEIDDADGPLPAARPERGLARRRFPPEAPHLEGWACQACRACRADAGLLSSRGRRGLGTDDLLAALPRTRPGGRGASLVGRSRSSRPGGEA